jgi:hypothetical protein
MLKSMFDADAALHTLTSNIGAKSFLHRARHAHYRIARRVSAQALRRRNQDDVLGANAMHDRWAQLLITSAEHEVQRRASP